MAEQMMQEAAGKAIPAGYKQTEVGVIPEDWDVFLIDNCAVKVGSGKTPTGGSSVYVDSGRPFVRSQNVGWGKLDLSDVAYITETVHSTFLGSEIKRDDVLLNITGASIGRCAKADEQVIGGNVNQHVCIIRVDGSKFVPIVLVELINSSVGQNQIDSFQAGGNREGLNFAQVRQLKFALPLTVVEQTAIANVLSDSDALIDALEQLIAKKQAIKSGTMQQLLTGRTRLPAFALRPDGTPKGYKPSELGDIPEDWEVAPFGNTLAIRHGKNQKAVENPNGTIPIFATGGQIGWAHQYLWNKPSVLIGRKGTIDKPRYSDKPFWTVDTLFYSEIKDCADPKFIFYKFCMIDWMQYNEASGVPSLNASTIERVLASLPLKEEQTAVAKILSDMDTEIQVLEQRLGKTCQIKQGMMQELLTGKTRLIEGSEAI
ncbi:TPA: restriction endonuclease subunit S [Aeromonas veronii]